MKITVDGKSLKAYSDENKMDYNKLKRQIERILKSKTERVRTIRKRSVIQGRLANGYSLEEAKLPKEEFEKIHAQRIGSHFVGKYNLTYVCKRLGEPLQRVYATCIRRKRMTVEEYLTAKGHDLTPFME